MPRTILNRYEIKGELGRGGMATVFLAHDRRFKRDVAIKTLPKQLTHDPQFLSRFEREAQTIASLEHPAIVPVYDFGQDGGQPFLVMRFMSGESLAERIAHAPLSLRATANVTSRVAEALEEAHSRGMIHRDIKPDNILFDQQGKAYLSDFGIVKIQTSSNTLSGDSIIGTPAYMSPEQARGVTVLDGRSDVYSLGVVLFEMLSGKLPFHSNTPLGMAMKHVTEPIPSIRRVNSGLPPRTEGIIYRALAKDREDRYATPNQLAKAVRVVARETPPKGIIMPPSRAKSTPTPRTPVTPSGGAAPIVAVSSLKEALSGSERESKPGTSPGSQPGEPAQEAPMWILWVGIGVIILGLLILFGLQWFTSNARGQAAVASPTAAITTTMEAVVAAAEATETRPLKPTVPALPTARAVSTNQMADSSNMPTATPIPPTPTATPIPPTATATPKPPTPTAAVLDQQIPEFVVTFNSINLRRGPGIGYEVVGVLYRDDRVEVVAHNDVRSWYLIKTPDGGFGWLSSSVVEAVDEALIDAVPVALTMPAPPEPTATFTATPLPPTEIPPKRNGGGGTSGPSVPPTLER